MVHCVCIAYPYMYVCMYVCMYVYVISAEFFPPCDCHRIQMIVPLTMHIRICMYVCMYVCPVRYRIEERHFLSWDPPHTEFPATTEWNLPLNFKRNYPPWPFFYQVTHCITCPPHWQMWGVFPLTWREAASLWLVGRVAEIRSTVTVTVTVARVFFYFLCNRSVRIKNGDGIWHVRVEPRVRAWSESFSHRFFSNFDLCRDFFLVCVSLSYLRWRAAWHAATGQVWQRSATWGFLLGISLRARWAMSPHQALAVGSPDAPTHSGTHKVRICFFRNHVSWSDVEKHPLRRHSQPHGHALWVLLGQFKAAQPRGSWFKIHLLQELCG